MKLLFSEVQLIVDVLVFRTSIQSPADLEAVTGALSKIDQIISWNTDLEDWENILRVEGIGIKPETVISIIKGLGIEIEELPD